MTRMSDRIHGVYVDSGPAPLHDWNDAGYFGAVARTLERLWDSHIGRIVLRHLGHASRRVTVRPYSNWTSDAIAVTHPASQLRSVSPVDGVLVAAGGSGRPDDAEIWFLPYFQGAPPPRGQNPARGIGASVDEALLEEVVHGLRCAHGVLDWRPAQYDYDCNDEAKAAAVVNMYRSEQRRAPIDAHVMGVRRAHRWLPAGHPPDAESRWWFEQRMVREFAGEMEDLVRELRAAPSTIAPHNPFHLYDTDRGPYAVPYGAQP
jgi:hypothetical protein